MKPDRLLIRTACITLACVPLLVVGLMLDPYQILGVSRWLKPLKFFVSGSVFLLTVAAMVRQLHPSATATRIAVGITACLTIENGLILMQSIRGVRSHFNHDTPFDAAVFGCMGLFIVINTLLVGGLFVLLFTNARPQPPALLLGLRLGVVFAILGSLQAFLMISRVAHTVGAVDGGPGMPLVNWSTTHGDLRVAHFIALHGFQALPLAGLLLSRGRVSHASLWVWLVFALYLAGAVTALLQALSAHPFGL
jgi:hypothetical protein